MITRTITINGKKLKTRVATTPREQARGLMYDEVMADDEGMLFEYPSERGLSFWMKNTKIPLSIAFIQKDGTISEIRDMKPFGLDSVRSAKPAKWALEVNQGWFNKNNIKVGDKINCRGRNIKLTITKN